MRHPTTQQPTLGEPQIEETDYDNIIAKIQEAATFAKHGIVAVAVGHGDGSTAWFNLVPEDAIYVMTGTTSPELFPSPPW